MQSSLEGKCIAHQKGRNRKERIRKGIRILWYMSLYTVEM